MQLDEMKIYKSKNICDFKMNFVVVIYSERIINF